MTQYKLLNDLKISYLWKWASDERNMISQLSLLLHQSLSWHQKLLANFWQLLARRLINYIFLCTAIVFLYFHLHLIGWLGWLIHPVSFPCCFSGGRLKWRVFLKVLWTLWKPCLLGRGRRRPLHFTSRYPTPLIFLIVLPRGVVEVEWCWIQQLLYT